MVCQYLFLKFFGFFEDFFNFFEFIFIFGILLSSAYLIYSCKYGFLAAGGYDSALMECYGAEVTRPEAASVMGYGKFNLIYSGNTAVLFIHGMVGTHIGK